MVKVRVVEAIHIRVARWLKEREHQIWLRRQDIENVSPRDSIPIYITRRKPIRFLGLKFSGFLKEYRVAYLHLRCERPDETGKNWVMEIYGREYVDLFTRIAQELSADFKANVHLRLEDEWPQLVTRDHF